MAELRLRADQQRFVQAIASGQSMADAYRAARFPRGDKISDEKARLGAGGMVTSRALASALARAQERVSERAELTVLDIVAKLERVYEIALASEPAQTSGAVAAQLGIAKLLGLVVDRSEAHIVHHKPSLLETKQLELTEDEWKRQFVTGHNDH